MTRPSSPQFEAQPPPPAAVTQRRSVWPTVIGVISIIVGAMGVTGGLVGLLQPQPPSSSQPATAPPPGPIRTMLEDMQKVPPWYRTATRACGVLFVLLSVLLIVAGLKLIQRRRVGRTLHMAYGAASVASLILSSAMELWLVQSPYLRPPTRLMMLGGWAVSSLVQWPYPLFVLVWFARSKVRQEVRSWDGPSSAGP